MTLSLPPHPLTGILCSRACPASLILRAHDLARAWAGAGMGVVGGLQSPFEAEMLHGYETLLVVLARGPGGRAPREWRAAQAEGRLTIVSPFAEMVKRPDRGHAEVRNRMVADLAARMLIQHAAIASRSVLLALDWLGANRKVWTLAHEANAGLLKAGAQVWNETADATSLT
ncbi:putative Rossmann fold nucleotide-binding protein DprA/Smf involved in DNA uptake [Deinococcus metalli]|uniref:Putative Rossmann fold nucleotide-binding protein DprA/Smf involved in DNA uptake n=1 Tax=Deinococcus metalli TaxID=1141878 RepID=A0A7W8NTY5_9DEIO|nr:hypothetical protein [Deinococcus metalli]MBB5378727.1 putative Rossmann fold nucleotide-binding protein DprA/Smf involved in DNA uptake [Deinococcus metalli]GHF60388.1 hypothetical protein GCM10017781_40710 [Deinococcus metalli]